MEGGIRTLVAFVPHFISLHFHANFNRHEENDRAHIILEIQGLPSSGTSTPDGLWVSYRLIQMALELLIYQMLILDKNKDGLEIL